MAKCSVWAQVGFQKIKADLSLRDHELAFVCDAQPNQTHQYHLSHRPKTTRAICESAAVSVSHLFRFICQKKQT